MGKLISVASLAILIILILITITAIILPWVLDPNDFKPEIEAAVYQQTGKKLVLGGDLELSLFPWFGLSTGKASVINPSSTEQKTLVKVDQADIKVKLLPLLFKSIELNRIVVVNPIIYLLKDQQGNINWQNSVSTESQSKIPETKISNSKIKTAVGSSFLRGLLIAGISLKNGTIFWEDRKKSQTFTIRQLDLNSETLTADRPAIIVLSMQVKRDDQSPKRVNTKTQLVFNQALNHYKLTDLDLKVLTNNPKAKQKVIALAVSPVINLDWQKQTVYFPSLKVASGNMVLTATLSGSEIKDQPVFKGSVAVREFNLREFYFNLGLPFPYLQDQSSLTRLSGSLAFSTNHNSAQLNNINIKFDDSTLMGHCIIRNFTKPKYEFNFNLDSINLDRYLISKTNSSDNTKTTANNKPQSPVAVAEKPSPSHQSAPLDLNATTDDNQKNKVETTISPIEQLRKIRATGRISISKMTTKGLKTQDLIIKLD